MLYFLLLPIQDKFYTKTRFLRIRFLRTCLTEQTKRYYYSLEQDREVEVPCLNPQWDLRLDKAEQTNQRFKESRKCQLFQIM